MMTFTCIPAHSIFQGTDSLLIWEVQQYHVFDFFGYLSHQMTLRWVQETKSSKTSVETNTGVTWKVYHICSLQIWNNKRLLKSSREKKVNVNVRFKFIGTPWSMSWGYNWQKSNTKKVSKLPSIWTSIISSSTIQLGTIPCEPIPV